MDQQIVKKLIGEQLPSNVCNLVLESNNQAFFALTGQVLEIGETSLIFKTKTRTAAVDYRRILELVPLDRKEL
jgi:uncharacterized protein involved in tolerance to divalent cations